MEQPIGFEEAGKEDWVWKLEQSLYSMKQSGHVWNQTLNECMISWGFQCLVPDYCIYYRNQDSHILIAVIHIDDFLLVSSLEEENEAFKHQMHTKWELSALGEARLCVGIAIKRDHSTRSIYLSQTALINKLITQFGQKDANPTTLPMVPGLKLQHPDLSTLSKEERQILEKLPYQSLVGALIYLAIGTWIDIKVDVQQLTQFLDCYSFEHWNAAIHLLRHLKGSRSLWLKLGGANEIKLIGYSDSDWANRPDFRRSVGGYAFSLGSGSISWSARKQRNVTTSSCEAKYVAAFKAAKEAVWIRQLLRAIGFPQNEPTTIYCDNNAARILSEDPLLHAQVKHMDIKYHYL
ncbi:hypothetical protein AX14_008508 [Amanita brunnescens Koide BX004]|nr:hypothetical protein AX14_008508 [Amanita brunnescens Koide BX004]